MTDRDRGRRWAMRGLYAWQTRGGEPGTEIRVLHDLMEGRPVQPEQRTYAEALTRLAAANVVSLDRTISGLLENWSLDRLSRLDRIILHIGATELTYLDDVPPSEAVRAGIRLAKRYGTDESPRFVNGVLDALRRRIESGSGSTHGNV